MNLNRKFNFQPLRQNTDKPRDARFISLDLKENSLLKFFNQNRIDRIVSFDLIADTHVAFKFCTRCINIAHQRRERTCRKREASYTKKHNDNTEDFFCNCYWSDISITNRCNSRDYKVKTCNVKFKLASILKIRSPNPAVWRFFHICHQDPKTSANVHQKKRNKTKEEKSFCCHWDLKNFIEVSDHFIAISNSF